MKTCLVLRKIASSENQTNPDVNENKSEIQRGNKSKYQGCFEPYKNNRTGQKGVIFHVIIMIAFVID